MAAGSVSGATYLFEAVNLEGRIWTSTATPKTFTTFSLCALFKMSCTYLSDPKVRFDAGSGRWFVVAISYQSPTGAWHLAVSTSLDPRSSYSLYTIASARGTFPDFPARACLRFMQVNLTPVSVSQALDVGAVGTYYYYPAIQLDAKGNLLAVFSGSSASTYASVYASGQPVSSSGTFGTVTLIKAGEEPYAPSTARWGDYSGAGIDPSGTSVWVAGEYALANNQWGTWLAEIGF